MPSFPRCSRTRDARNLAPDLLLLPLVNGVEYLRTDANLTAKDNLDNLPLF